jgi:pSer/pThr/pTyr-binding forkhead associated (FHA) protein
MPVSIIVRSVGSENARLTFDGTQRIVIGRGAGSDVRLPDASVSHRHASLRARGAEFVLLDEGSTNGTFIGGVAISAHTSRIVRSGDLVRVGRVWLELKIDFSPITRDVAAATRDLALALVSRAMAAMGTDPTTKVRVLEGPDQGATLHLAEEGREYVVGRAPHCSMCLADPDASREHARLMLRHGVAIVRDLGTKNGTWIGDARVTNGSDVAWRPIHMMRIGRTVLALEEPVNDAMALIEQCPDEVLAPSHPSQPPPPAGLVTPGSDRPDGDGSLPRPSVAQPAEPRRAQRRLGWSAADLVVMATAIGVLALSIAGLVWLLRG